MISLNFKKLLASAALVACTLSPVSAQNPLADDVQAPTVAVASLTEDTTIAKRQPVPYDMSKRDEGFLGVLQEGLSHVLPTIGKIVKKITPTGYAAYFAAADKADAKVAEAMTNNPNANLYVELAKNAAEPAKVVVTDFAIPAYTKVVEAAPTILESIFKFFSK